MISLIVLAEDNKDSLKKCLESLEKQIFKDFELLIVDRNIDNRLYEVIVSFNKILNIKYVKNTGKSIVRDINKALTYRKGNIIGVIKDTDEFSENALEMINNKLENDKSIYISNVENIKEDNKVNKYNIWKYISCNNYFINFGQEDILLHNHKIVEYEDIDYIIQLINDQYDVHYYSEEILKNKIEDIDYTDVNKIFEKTLYKANIMKKEIKRFNILYLFVYIYELIKSLCKIVVSKHKEYDAEIFNSLLQGIFKGTK